MTSKDMILASLAPANGALHTPVQVQKLLFLIDREASTLVGGPYFHFQPYNYGPFDKAVYDGLRQLRDEGLVEMVPDWNWNSYQLTRIGQERGQQLLQSLRLEAQRYIVNASDFVRKLSFSDLVSAIYKAYPDMRRNSVFQE